ncbi:cytochrome b5-like [Aricia agestis]|uniref:cytochrome b5-like n=1 Tax=Aricia agestis TaxID=91739 RepID=UPI001C209B39|nr:cytochrome b5-like [Aricia agestis]
MSRVWTRAEVAARCRADDAAIVIDNVVYDITSFIGEHPGGPEVLLANVGRDASKCFHDVGHSDAALEWRATFRAGEIAADERWEELGPRRDPPPEPPPPFTLRSLLDAALPPLAMAAAALALYWGVLS